MFDSKNRIWSRIAEKLGGNLEKSSIFKNTELTVPYKDWTIHMVAIRTAEDTKRELTRIFAPFSGKSDLKFKIYQENPLHAIGKFFKMQDIEIHDPDFDKRFMIKGNDESMIRIFLQASNIKTLIPSEPFYTFKLESGIEKVLGLKMPHNYPEGTQLLTLQYEFLLEDEEKIKTGIELIKQSLDRFVSIGIADSRPVET